MKTLYMALLAAITFAGCNAQTNTQQPITGMASSNGSKGGVYTYLALGDSYTIGQSVPQASSFPYQLTARLNTAGENVQAPTIIATTGWTTDNLIDAISQSTTVRSQTFDFVTLLIGVNDQYQGLSQDNYRTKFRQVLGTAIQFAKGDTSRVFVVSIPDYGVTPFANGQEATIGPLIDQFNAINLDESQKAGVHYINITPISKAAATDLTLVADDGLHPSAKMYGLWVTLIEPAVKARLDK